ncbi:hypothetical protein L9F63_004921, partial [Diploptera punctata]
SEDECLSKTFVIFTLIMFSVYAEKRNLIESTKEFNWKNRRISVILCDADVVVYADENNGSSPEDFGWIDSVNSVDSDWIQSLSVNQQREEEVVHLIDINQSTRMQRFLL